MEVLVMKSAVGVIEQLFDRLAAGDWAGYGALLSANVERIGPWGDRMLGRDRYIELMSGPTNRTTWTVHRIAYAPDGRSGFARVTARLGPNQAAPCDHFEETLGFEMDDAGLVCRVEVFWQTPWLAPPS
jgi:hypothetical protein